MIPVVRLLLVLSATVSRANCKPRPDTSRDCAHSESTLERSATTGMESEMVTGTISADGNVAITILEELENRLSRLERRLRAVEQPVWQMSSAEEDWEICAEGPCRCQPETKSVSCWRQNLLDLPAAQLVPRDVLKLDLAGNRLTALHRDTFLDMTRLNHLDISDNSIEHLPLNLFFSLHAVTRIRLSKNLLGELHRSQFLSTRNLRILDASSNRLQTLPESLFLSTTSLVLLDLSCNQLSSFASETFRGLSTLEELLLGKNRLSTLPVDLFKDLTNLKYLGLEENRLKQLSDELFRAQASLQELNVRGNQLTEISASLLAPLERLRSLEMSNNKIARIDSLAFHGLVALKELQLGHNRIRNLTPGLFSNSTGLERLVLYANGIESLSRGAFHGLSNLTSLFLHSNHLSNLHPDLFEDTPSLRKLQLESNYLSSLPPRIFDTVQFIEQLRLARNPWHCDCAVSYLAMWLQRMYLARVNETKPGEDLGVWEFGAGAVCRGPGTLGGKLLLHLTFHELCEGQWASMRGLVPRLPVDRTGSGGGRVVASTDDPFSRNEPISVFNLSRSLSMER
ncbi:leucine-rich repeat-containing protein 15-like [Bombus vosnesenskii]|uniref:Leucine-rich repeat-containing protein 15-like n=1 Tax=Bombus vosnesenskii TaxID=207650 RepID=A0A6J3JT63_9HYME|nr:leucine-rich repeat-containing protein 15-like [Bombus vosnesenskii]